MPLKMSPAAQKRSDLVGYRSGCRMGRRAALFASPIRPLRRRPARAPGISALFQVPDTIAAMVMLFHLARHRLPIAVVVVCGELAIAGCGSSSKHTMASSSNNSAALPPGLAYSRCMRAHRVSHFPDPNVGGGFQVNVSGYHTSVSIGDIPGINQQSPAFLAANSTCQNLLPAGGGARPGAQHPSAAAMEQARTAAKCMRAHGVPNFPDPGTVMPSNPPAIGTVDNINGAVFLIPGSIDLQAPAVQHAATVCQFPGGLL